MINGAFLAIQGVKAVKNYPKNWCLLFILTLGNILVNTNVDNDLKLLLDLLTYPGKWFVKFQIAIIFGFGLNGGRWLKRG